jgi:uncharacterized membrane protein
VIRDPKRIIQLYELAVALLVALFVARLPANSLFQVFILVLVLLLLVTDWNRTVLDFARPTSLYARWVEAPIDIDSSCKSFLYQGRVQRVHVALTSHVDALRHRFDVYLAEPFDSDVERV